MFREKIGCVVLRIHSTHGLTFISYPLLYWQASYLNVFESSALQNVSCRVWIHFETNWNFVVKFLEEFCESQHFSGASTGCVELCFTRTETDCSLLQTSVTHRYVLYIAMISRNTLARCRIAGPIWVTTTNKFQPVWTISRGSRRRQVCVPVRYRICFTVGLRTCWMANCKSGLQIAMKMSFPTAVRKLE